MVSLNHIYIQMNLMPPKNYKAHTQWFECIHFVLLFKFVWYHTLTRHSHTSLPSICLASLCRCIDCVIAVVTFQDESCSRLVKLDQCASQMMHIKTDFYASFHLNHHNSQRPATKSWITLCECINKIYERMVMGIVASSLLNTKFRTYSHIRSCSSCKLQPHITSPRRQQQKNAYYHICVVHFNIINCEKICLFN